MNRKTLKKFKYFIPLLILGFVCFYIYKYNIVFVDSDASSGLLFAKEIANAGELLPDTWHYSTTIFLIDYPVIYALLFLFTSNWLTVRAIGTFIILVFYLLAAFYLFRKLEIKHIVLSLILLLMPFSVVYFGMYIAMPYYVFVSIKTFLSIGIVIDIFKTSNNKKRIVLFIALCLLSLVQGLDGFRNIVLCITPMVLTLITCAVLNLYGIDNIKNNNNNIKLLKIVLIIGISCLVGYLINSLLITKQLGISSFSNINYSVITSDVIIQEINSWLNTFGYTNGKALSSFTLHNILCFTIIILSISSVIYNIKHRNELRDGVFILTIFYSFGVLMLIVFGLFIDMNQMGLYDIARYNLPMSILSIPLIILLIENIKEKNRINKYIFIGFIVLMIVVGVDNYRLCSVYDKDILSKINSGRVNNDTVELNGIVYQLKEKGYKNGYSYFWCGNVITELSNGDIEMWVLAPGGNHTKKLDDLSIRYKWLQSKKHDSMNPTGKTFIIFNKEELDYSCITEKLNWNNVIYDSDNYTVYGYESNNKLLEDFNN